MSEHVGIYTFMTEDQNEYVKRFANLITGFPEIDLPSDLMDRIFSSLAQAKEADISPNTQNIAVPWIDRELLALVDSDMLRNKRKTVWPGNKPFALCLTHDVDFVSSVDHSKKFFRRLRRVFKSEGPKNLPFYHAAGSLYRLATGINKSDSLANYDNWLNIEDKYGFKSTFNFCSFPTRKENVLDCDYKLTDTVIFDGKSMNVANMIKTIDEAGWEIGLHGSMGTFNDLELLKEQKQTIEAVINKEIISTRNHYLKNDFKITPRFQAEVGFRNDSTIGCSKIAGFISGTSFPYWIWDVEAGHSLPLLEIPMSLMDVTLFSKCASRKEFDNVMLFCIKVMDEVEAVGGCLTLNWHPNYLINDFYWDAYNILLQEANRRKAWGCTAKDISEYWQ